MDDVERYAWLGRPRFEWLRRGACVGFVRGLDEDEVVRRLGGDPAGAAPLRLAGLDVRPARGGGAPSLTLATVTMGDWVVVAERSGWHGVVPETLAVSAGAELVAVAWDAEGAAWFLHAVDGELVTGLLLDGPSDADGGDRGVIIRASSSG
jgi:hypothetical protein